MKNDWPLPSLTGTARLQAERHIRHCSVFGGLITKARWQAENAGPGLAEQAGSIASIWEAVEAVEAQLASWRPSTKPH
jgi:hypothetical protein